MDFGIDRRLQPPEIAAAYGAAPQTSPRRFTETLRMSRTQTGLPDLQTQLEELFGEVWRQESFERNHPFTCGVIREAFGFRRRGDQDARYD